MENNEKHIVKNLRDYREEIDLDSLWNDVSPHIPKPKKRRKLGFWMFGGLLIGLVTISVIMLTGGTTEASDGKITEVEKLEIDTKKHCIEEKDMVSGDSDNEATELFVAHEDNFTNNRSEIIVKNNSADDKLKGIKKQVNNTKESIGSDLSIDAKSKTTRKQSSLDNNFMRTTALSKVQEENINQTSVNSAEPEMQSSSQERRSTVSHVVPFLQNVKLLKYVRSMEKPHLDLKIINTGEYHSTSNKWSFYLQGGGAIVNRDLSIRSEEMQGERDRRVAVAEVLGAWEVEGGLGFQLSPKLRLMTGLSYMQIHEKANYSSEELIDFETNSENLIRKQDGSEEIITESIKGQGITYREEIRYNHVKFLQIPIRLTYELLTLNKLKLNIGGLAAYSLQQKYEGYTSLSSSMDSYDLQMDKDAKFRKSGSLSFGFFLEGTTHITEMMDMSFSLGYKQTKKINNEIYLIDQQYNSLTFNTGIRRRF